MGKIKVLQVGLSAVSGGIENCIMNYYRYINKENFKFDFVDIFGKGLVFSDEINQLGGKVYSLKNCTKHPFLFSREFENLLRNNHYDIVHINVKSAVNIMPIMSGIKCFSTVVVVHCHNSNIYSNGLNNITHRAHLGMVRKLKVEKWACGKMAGEWLWGNQFSYNDIIVNAIDEKNFLPNSKVGDIIRSQCGFSKESKVVGYVGSLTEQKNIMFLADIFEQLVESDVGYRLLVVGTGKLSKKFIDKINKKGLKSKVFIAGAQEDVQNWYQAMDCIVLPSLYEGFPLVGVEGQAAGKKCFMSDTISKEINISGSVEFIPIDDAKKWSAEITRFFDNGYEFLGRLPEKYCISNAVKELEKKYERLV